MNRRAATSAIYAAACLGLILIAVAIALDLGNRSETTSCPAGQFPNGENAAGAFIGCTTATALVNINNTTQQTTFQSTTIQSTTIQSTTIHSTTIQSTIIASTVTNAATINATRFINNVALQGVYSYPLGIGSFTIIPLPIAEPNTVYGVVCNTEDTLHFAVSISAKTTTTFTVNYPNALAGTTVSCLVFHA